ncbi:MAG: hypothetical protein K8R76_08135 [Candidatus Aegiribacteria sp.]|nr:hypothetical protein [Candidatus Aegiribacteria sp.]
MEYFIDEKGKYVFKGSTSGVLRRIFTVVIIATVVMMVGVSLTLYFSMEKQSFSSINPVIPFIPLMMFPFTLIVLFAVRKRIGNAGTVKVDYMKNTVSFSQRIYNSYRAITIGSEQITRVMISRKECASYGYSNSVIWTVSIMTDQGQFDLMADRSEVKARGFVDEFSSLVSRSVDDLTRGT